MLWISDSSANSSELSPRIKLIKIRDYLSQVMLGTIDGEGNIISLIEGGPDGGTHALEFTPGILSCNDFRYLQMLS